jgi:hypothetical protein
LYETASAIGKRQLFENIAKEASKCVKHNNDFYRIASQNSQKKQDARNQNDIIKKSPLEERNETDRPNNLNHFKFTHLNST